MRDTAAHRAAQNGPPFKRIVAEVFRKAGWRVRRYPSAGDSGADLVVDHGAKTYIVEVKSASEGRRDRLVPLLSQAILEAKALARRFPERARPLAVVAARYVPASVADHVQQFAQQHAPEVAVGVIDAEGLRSFVGPGLERLDSKPESGKTLSLPPVLQLPDLFSDLNQWMLKILLGQRLPESFISVPREPIQNASHLAASAGVSIMSASRFLNRLASEGFLDKASESLQIVRVEELLERWVAANRNLPQDLPTRWIIKHDATRFLATVARYAAKSLAKKPSPSPFRTGRNFTPQARCCLGLFAAADVLGLGFVHGVPKHLYLERLALRDLLELGLAREESDRVSDVYIRSPRNKEAIFRGAVVREGLPVSDVLQVWLDTTAYPARGAEQADQIRRRILEPLFTRKR